RDQVAQERQPLEILCAGRPLLQDEGCLPKQRSSAELLAEIDRHDIAKTVPQTPMMAEIPGKARRRPRQAVNLDGVTASGGGRTELETLPWIESGVMLRQGDRVHGQIPSVQEWCDCRIRRQRLAWQLAVSGPNG